MALLMSAGKFPLDLRAWRSKDLFFYFHPVLGYIFFFVLMLGSLQPVDIFVIIIYINFFSEIR